MAKVEGPLFSISAGGKLADSIVFANWKGIPYVRKYVIPSNPQTAGQTAIRDAFRAYVEQWQLLIVGDKESWTNRSKELGYQFSGFNFWVQQCFEQTIDPLADPFVPPVMP